MHKLIILIAKDLIVVLPILLAVVFFKLPRQNKRNAVILFIKAAFFTALFAFIGSKLFYDPRPFVAGHFTPYFAHGNDNGFPSDHTLLAGLCAALIYVYSKRLGALAFVLAVLIGAARVIAGVHHVTDIIGALVIACFATLIAQLLVRRFLTKNQAE